MSTDPYIAIMRPLVDAYPKPQVFAKFEATLVTTDEARFVWHAFHPDVRVAQMQRYFDAALRLLAQEEAKAKAEKAKEEAAAKALADAATATVRAAAEVAAKEAAAKIVQAEAEAAVAARAAAAAKVEAAAAAAAAANAEAAAKVEADAVAKAAAEAAAKAKADAAAKAAEVEVAEAAALKQQLEMVKAAAEAAAPPVEPALEPVAPTPPPKPKMTLEQKLKLARKNPFITNIGSEAAGKFAPFILLTTHLGTPLAILTPAGVDTWLETVWDNPVLQRYGRALRANMPAVSRHGDRVHQYITEEQDLALYNQAKADAEGLFNSPTA